jgi:hypothetical protein
MPQVQVLRGGDVVTPDLREPLSVSMELRAFVPPCEHVPPRSERGGDPDMLDDLEAGRPVVVTAWELSRLVRLVPHPAVEHPWEDPRWFRVSSDDLVVEVEEPAWNKEYGMYPASGVFARTARPPR